MNPIENIEDEAMFTAGDVARRLSLAQSAVYQLTARGDLATRVCPASNPSVDAPPTTGYGSCSEVEHDSRGQDRRGGSERASTKRC